MKTKMKHSLLAASLVALVPVVSADDKGPDFGLEVRAAAEATTNTESPSSVPDIKIEIDGRKIELKGNQIEAMIGEVMKSLAADNGKAARDMVSGLLGVEPGSEAEMLRSLMEQIPQIKGGSASSFEIGGEPGVEFEAKAYMIGPDGEKREIEINSDEIRRKWKLHRQHARGGEPVPMPEGEAAEVHQLELPPFYIGVAVDPAPEALRSHFELGDAGVVVNSVFAGSPAAEAGLQPNDLIVKADRVAQNSVETLMEAVRKAADKEMKLEVLRGAETKEFTVKPARREEPAVSGLFVPKLEPDAAPEAVEQDDELQELRQEVRETHELLEKILERMEKLEKGE